MHYLGERQQEYFNFERVSESTVYEMGLSIRNSAHRHDQNRIQVYKEYFRSIRCVISKIYNSSLELGEFPKPLQIGKVRCIFKADDKNLIKKHRL